MEILCHPSFLPLRSDPILHWDQLHNWKTNTAEPFNFYAFSLFIVHSIFLFASSPTYSLARALLFYALPFCCVPKILNANDKQKFYLNKNSMLIRLLLYFFYSRLFISEVLTTVAFMTIHYT